MNLLMHYNYTDHLRVSVSAPRLYLSSKLCSSINCAATEANNGQNILTTLFSVHHHQQHFSNLQCVYCCVLPFALEGVCTHHRRANCKKKMRKPYACFVHPHNITFPLCYFVLMMRMLIAIRIIMVPCTPYWISHLSLFGSCTFSECRAVRILLMILILI